MTRARDSYAFDARDFTLRERGRKFEDFEVGHVFFHHWGRTIEQSDNSAFCAATCTWNPLHLNTEFAISQGHPDCVISASLVLCVVVGLTVEDLSEVAGPFLGMTNCIFQRPVYPGDTLTASSVVLQCRQSHSRPGTGIVTWRTEGRNQRGEVVVTLERSNLVEMRSPSTKSPAVDGEQVG